VLEKSAKFLQGLGIREYVQGFVGRPTEILLAAYLTPDGADTDIVRVLQKCHDVSQRFPYDDSS
jgi:fructose-1-phosphate kinase PfkB-like protein